MPIVDKTAELKVWRYISVSGLLSTLNSRKLRFTNLRYFPDEWEGAGPTELNQIRTYFSENAEILAEQFRFIRQASYASSWSLNSPAEMSMWTSYAECSSWVAIEMTLGNLKDSLGSNPSILHIDYVTYWQDIYPISKLNPNTGSLMKQSAFEFENEVRLTFFDENQELNYENPPKPIYKFFDLDIKKIDRIVSHPYMLNHNRQYLRKKLNKIENAPSLDAPLIGVKPIEGSESLDRNSRLRMCKHRRRGRCCGKW